MTTKTGNCDGNSDEHCCWVDGQECLYVEENTVEGRRWSCGLRRELGNWDDVLASDRYQENVAVHFEPKGIDCKSWPPAHRKCTDCGYNC